MRFMIMVKANKDPEDGVMPQEQLIAAMATYHEELVKAGVLIDASGLQPSSKGWRIKYSGGKRTVIDGPFIESKELIAGYTIIQVKSKKEAVVGSSVFPLRTASTRTVKSRFASYSSWRTLAPARQSNAFTT